MCVQYKLVVNNVFSTLITISTAKKPPSVHVVFWILEDANHPIRYGFELEHSSL